MTAGREMTNGTEGQFGGGVRLDRPGASTQRKGTGQCLLYPLPRAGPPCTVLLGMFYCLRCAIRSVYSASCALRAVCVRVSSC